MAEVKTDLEKVTSALNGVCATMVLQKPTHRWPGSERLATCALNSRGSDVVGRHYSTVDTAGTNQQLQKPTLNTQCGHVNHVMSTLLQVHDNDACSAVMMNDLATRNTRKGEVTTVHNRIPD